MNTMKNKVTLSDIPEKGMPLEMKPLLTLKEASLYTGIGINKLRDMSNERNCNMFCLWDGSECSNENLF